MSDNFKYVLNNTNLTIGTSGGTGGGLIFGPTSGFHYFTRQNTNVYKNKGGHSRVVYIHYKPEVIATGEYDNNVLSSLNYYIGSYIFTQSYHYPGRCFRMRGWLTINGTNGSNFNMRSGFSDKNNTVYAQTNNGNNHYFQGATSNDIPVGFEFDVVISNNGWVYTSGAYWYNTADNSYIHSANDTVVYVPVWTGSYQYSDQSNQNSSLYFSFFGTDTSFEITLMNMTIEELSYLVYPV
jgi:hypothetical protein